MTVTAIRTSELTKYYGPVVGVEELSLEISQGEIFGFLGANGAGKTTTIRSCSTCSGPRGNSVDPGFDCHRRGLEAPAGGVSSGGDTGISNFRRRYAFLSALRRRHHASAWMAAPQVRRDDLDLRRRMRDYSMA
jgi:energy-coupling factor transporter ATP-binding protein EcfA2